MGFYRYRYGMVIGRFQPFHYGHECIITRALNECEYVVVIIGSAQESRLPHNPLTAEERISMIRECFWDEQNRLLFLPLEDRPAINNDSSWGEYMMNEIQKRIMFLLTQFLKDAKIVARTGMIVLNILILFKLIDAMSLFLQQI